MPIDPSIALGVKPPQIESPLNMMAQVLQAQGLQSKNALAQYSLGKAQRQDQQTNAMLQALQGGADPTTSEGQLALIRANPEGAGALIKNYMEGKKMTSEIGKNDAEAQFKLSDSARLRIGQYRENSQSITDPQSAVQFVTAMHADPALKDTPIARIPLEQAIAQIPQDPAQLGAWKQQFALGATKFMELNKPTTNVVNAGGTSQVLQTPGLGGTPQIVANVQHTQSPDSIATNATSRDNNAATIAKDFTIAGVNPDGTSKEGGGLMSPEAKINAAARYNMDGTLPPNLGRGAQGSRNTMEILNEAARQAGARGDTPEQQRIAQLANKSGAAALTKISTQEAQVGAFEKNFVKNAGIVEELSAKVDRTGVPLANKWINAGKRALTGDPDLSAFDTSVKATVNEYAKIVSGATGSQAATDSEIKHINDLLNAAQTPEQVKSVLDLMRRETGNRMSSFAQQKNEIQAGMIPTKPKAIAAPGSANPVTSAIDAELARRGGK